MKYSEKKGRLATFLKNRSEVPLTLRNEVTLSEVLYLLGDIEADATEYYTRLAEFTDLPWVRDFALKLAGAEEQHRRSFLDFACKVESKEGGENNCLKEPLSEELLNLFSERITLSSSGVEKTAAYIGEKDAIELAIVAEIKTVKLLSQLQGYLPEEQQCCINRIVNEEKQHQSFLESLYRKHFPEQKKD